MKWFALKCCPLVFTAVALLPGCAPRSAESVELSTQQRANNLAAFDQVWTTIKERHWDPSLGGVDWEAARDQIRPEVETARSMNTVRSAMRGLIGKLHQSHFAIIPGEAYAADAQGSSTSSNGAAPAAHADGVTGITPRMVSGKPTVWRVAPGSPAAQAGVQPGWIITSVDEESLDDLLLTSYAAYDTTNEREVGQTLEIVRALHGEVDQKKSLELLDAQDHARSLSVTLVRPDGSVSTLGNLPPMYVEFEAHRLADGAGYIAFSTFLNPAELMPQIESAVMGMLDAPGLILDLRGNPGGLGAMSMGIAGWFVSEPGESLGRLQARDGAFSFDINPRPTTYSGPLAILVDCMSMSTSEILAGGLHDLGRARLFGTHSAGEALPSVIEVLPNGDRFQYAFANYISAGGAALEGRGVAIDEPAPLTRAALLAGRDPALEAAQEWIRTGPARAAAKPAVLE